MTMFNHSVVLCLMALVVIVTAQGQCPAGFDDETFDKTCYYFSVQNKATEAQAKAECQSLGASLVSMECEEEFNFVQNKVSTYGESYWTSAERVPEQFYWGTGQGIATDYYGWADGSPNNENGNENCLAMTTDKNYYVDDLPCGDHISFICEKFVLPCPDGFVEDTDNGGCFFLHDANDKSWLAAKKACEDLDAMLATFVADRPRFRFIRSAIKAESTSLSYWINAQKAEFVWGSGQVLSSSFAGWQGGYPDNAGGNEDCVELDSNSGFRLNDKACGASKSYVCETIVSCSDGFIYNSETCSCYFVADKSITMSVPDAQNACEKLDSELISLETVEEHNFISEYLKANGGYRQYWTSGVRIESKLMWASGSTLEVTFDAWHLGEPSSAAEDCVEMRKDFGHDLNDLTCGYTMYFVCEMPVDSCTKCLKNDDFNSCYYFHNGPPLNWLGAKNFCEFGNGHLVSFESMAEYNWVKSQLPNLQQSYWTGGYRVQFAWGNGVIIPNPRSDWHSGQSDGDGNCLETWDDGLNDLPCTHNRAYICETSGGC